jgi:hypothetical protein
MDSREIADKIKLGEEQLAALKETLSANSWSCCTYGIGLFCFNACRPVELVNLGA